MEYQTNTQYKAVDINIISKYINLNISFFQLYTIVKLKSSAIKVELNFR